MIRRCTRCGQEFVVCTVDQRRCGQCARESAALVASDTRRRNVVRFQRARDFSAVAA